MSLTALVIVSFHYKRQERGMICPIGQDQAPTNSRVCERSATHSFLETVDIDIKMEKPQGPLVI